MGIDGALITTVVGAAEAAVILGKCLVLCRIQQQIVCIVMGICIQIAAVSVGNTGSFINRVM